MIGFSMIAGSVGMFVLMVLLGFISIPMSLGPGLGFSGGTCNSTRGPSGVGRDSVCDLNLAFPLWPDCFGKALVWFRSAEDTDDAVVKVRIGIVAGIALIAVISFAGLPWLL